MSPILIVLVSACGGALVTVVGAFVGAYVQGLREHKKWLRDRRMSLYVELSNHMSTLAECQEELWEISVDTDEDASSADFARIDSKREAINVRLRKLIDDTHIVAAGLKILGPEAVDTAVFKLQKQVSNKDRSAFHEARLHMLSEMKHALGVRQ